MDWFARRFVKASLVWLSVGATIGLAMAVRPSLAVYRPAHQHAMLLGFVTMMIYGVAYHVLPRFAGSRLRSRTLAGVHWWTANPGLAAMIIGFVLRVSPKIPVAAGTAALAVGGLLSAGGAFVFAWNMWQTVHAAPLTIVGRAVATARRADPSLRS